MSTETRHTIENVLFSDVNLYNTITLLVMSIFSLIHDVSLYAKELTPIASLTVAGMSIIYTGIKSYNELKSRKNANRRSKNN